MPIEKLNPLLYMGQAEYTGFWQKLFATILYGFWGRCFFVALVVSAFWVGVRQRNPTLAAICLLLAVFVSHRIVGPLRRMAVERAAHVDVGEVLERRIRAMHVEQVQFGHRRRRISVLPAGLRAWPPAGLRATAHRSSDQRGGVRAGGVGRKAFECVGIEHVDHVEHAVRTGGPDRQVELGPPAWQVRGEHEHGQAAADALIRELELERIFGLQPGGSAPG